MDALRWMRYWLMTGPDAAGRVDGPSSSTIARSRLRVDRSHLGCLPWSIIGASTALGRGRIVCRRLPVCIAFEHDLQALVLGAGPVEPNKLAEALECEHGEGFLLSRSNPRNHRRALGCCPQSASGSQRRRRQQGLRCARRLTKHSACLHCGLMTPCSRC
jgi:hypothetical protein